MDVQHVNVKIFALEPFAGDLANAIPVFHRWIQHRSREEIMIDVADYRHVPNGPGVILIGHEADYILDNTGGRLGLLYNRKQRETGSAVEKIERSYRAALAACQMLEADPAFRGALKFNYADFEIIFNYRLLVPNTTESFDDVQPEIHRLATVLWPQMELDIEHVGEPRERLRVRVARKTPGLQAV